MAISVGNTGSSRRETIFHVPLHYMVINNSLYNTGTLLMTILLLWFRFSHHAAEKKNRKRLHIGASKQG